MLIHILPRKLWTMNSKAFSLAGGFLSIIAIGLPWWTAIATAKGVTAVFLLEYGFPPQPPGLGPWGLGNGLEIDYRMLLPSIAIDLPFMTMAGLLGIVGFRQRLLRAVAAGLLAGALLAFLIGLSRAIMPPIGPFGWYGSTSGWYQEYYGFGSVTWGLSMGFYVAALGLLFLLLSAFLEL